MSTGGDKKKKSPLKKPIRKKVGNVPGVEIELEKTANCVPQAEYIPKDVTDRVLSMMGFMKDPNSNKTFDMNIPAPDLFFASVGIPKKVFKTAMFRAIGTSSAPVDPRDAYLFAQVKKKVASLELELLKRVLVGDQRAQGAERVLKMCIKEWNHDYKAELNRELEHMITIMVNRIGKTDLKRVSQTDLVLSILDDFMEYQPLLDMDEETRVLSMPDVIDAAPRMVRGEKERG